MKKNLLFTFTFCLFAFVANTQTRLTNNPVLIINLGNSVTCASPSPDFFLTAENSFYNVYDLDNYANIVDTAFIVRMYVGCEQTDGGAHVIVGKVHRLVGTPSLLNLTLISDDTIAIYPDSANYKIKIPFTEGYVLPGDSLAAELHLPINASVSFFPGSNTSPESSPTYIVASGCSINDFTPMSSIGFASMHLLMNVYVNQRPSMTNGSGAVLKNDTLQFIAAEFTTNFNDNDNDGLTMVKVVTLPSNGDLELSGTPLIVGDTVLTSELTMLEYIPTTGFAGSDNFSVRAADTTLWANVPSVYDITVIDWAVSIAELENSAVTIYPNPANAQISIQVNEPILQIKVINADGKLVLTRVSNESILDISKLESGNYFIEIKTANETYLKQFIKQ